MISDEMLSDEYDLFYRSRGVCSYCRRYMLPHFGCINRNCPIAMREISGHPIKPFVFKRYLSMLDSFEEIRRRRTAEYEAFKESYRNGLIPRRKDYRKINEEKKQDHEKHFIEGL